MPPPREGPLGVLGRIVSTFAGGAPDAPRTVWDSFAPWVQQLTVAASTRWLPYLVLGIPCQVAEHGQPCPMPSISACGVCHQPCCLDHGMPAKDGAVCCRVCFARAVVAADPKVPGAKSAPGKARARQRPDPPPRSEPPPRPDGGGAPRPKNRPPAEAFTRAYGMLGVAPGTPWPDLERAYNKLLARWHPDRFPAHQKADAEKRFKEIRSAYDFLKEHTQ